MRKPFPLYLVFPVGVLVAAACASTTATRPSDGTVALPAEHAEPKGKIEGPGAESHAPGDDTSAHDTHAEAAHQHEEADEHPSTSEPPSAAASSEGTTQSGAEDARTELTAYEKAKPVFDAHCARCHTSQGAKSSKSALRHFSMDSYPFGGHHADEMTATVRKVLGVNSSKATMPRDKPGAVQGNDLQLILAWAMAFDRSHAGGESSHDHDHGAGEHHH